GSAGDERPYIMLEKGLSALVSRPVFYELAEMSVLVQKARGRAYGVADSFSPLKPTGNRPRDYN
ncbi:MAG: DUF1285 domain-containing protein, partial [Alphaproteobacteria bacterium]|nr:DUF1285 domain-containing protein [Alphaproteobacteria bacterium]